jgi:hypothetical protein
MCRTLDGAMCIEIIYRQYIPKILDFPDVAIQLLRAASQNVRACFDPNDTYIQPVVVRYMVAVIAGRPTFCRHVL